jgi:hypothetical protein
MIGNNIERTVEFTIYKMRTTDDCHEKREAYLLERDGATVDHFKTLKDTHEHARYACRSHGIKGAGLTEAFGRNRQFVLTPRGAWKRYKVAENA